MSSDCRQLHETVIRDIYDVISDVNKDYNNIEWLRTKNNTGSIARRASNLILVFPVLVSSSLSIETAMIISKAIERKCCSLLQILFSAAQFTEADDMYEYVRQFHTNLDLKGRLTLDDFLDIMNTMVDEGAITITDHDIYMAVKEDMKNINFMLSSEFNPTSINDYKSVTNAYGESTILLEKKYNINDNSFNGDNDHSNNYVTGDNSYRRYGDNSSIYQSGSADFSDRSVHNDRRQYTYNNSRQNARGGVSSLKDDVELFKSQLLPNDIKKANELMPTNMIVNFITVRDGNKIDTTGVIGVKAKLYPIDSADIVNRLASKVVDKNGLFNLIRATTREISFFKDLAFAIDKAKLDAVYMAKDSNNAKMFKVLERRAAKNKFSTLLKKNNASPITSLVISDAEVEYLKKYNNIDMTKSNTTRTLLEAYNLMDIVIADESLEIAKFLFDDGDGVFETLTFDALEKEASDKSYKKVINLMSKMNR